MRYRLPFNKAKAVSNFGMRHIFGSNSFHYGIDFVIIDKKIYATETGKVIVARVNGGYGKNIMIQHPDGLISVYGHLSKILVKEGQVVERGQYIGVEGSTGRSTGSHLHFEFRTKRWDRDKNANPAKYIDNFKPQVDKVYEHVESLNYVDILKEKTDKPDMWLGFIDKEKNDSLGKWLPQFIEKTYRKEELTNQAEWDRFIIERKNHPVGKWLPELIKKLKD